MEKQFIAYYRVSTTRQGVSGLGLEAQRSAAKTFASQSSSNIVREFTEVESGKKITRPKLHAAIEECRISGATLLIAKIDRLARNVHFISGLLETNINFVAADMPNADRFMLHIYAAMAEEEGRRISERTKAALASAKTRGIKLGEHCKEMKQQNSFRALQFAAEVGPRMAKLKREGYSVREIADYLNLECVPTYRSGKWHSNSIQRVWKRYVGSMNDRSELVDITN